MWVIYTRAILIVDYVVGVESMWLARVKFKEPGKGE